MSMYLGKLLFIYIYIMHIPFSIQYCSKGVAELIPHEDKCWSNVRVQYTFVYDCICMYIIYIGNVQLKL